MSGLFVGGCAGSQDRDPSSVNQEYGSCKIFFNHTNYCANLIWDQLPNDENNSGSFYLEFFEQNNPSVPAAPPGSVTVTVVQIGTNAQTPVVVEGKNINQFFIPQAHISQRGPWEIHVYLSDNNAVIDEGVFKYNRL
jgi:hypothetical protein